MFLLRRLTKFADRLTESAHHLDRKQQQDRMPAEILNRLGSLIPSIEAPAPNKNTGSSPHMQPQNDLKSELRAMKFLWNLPIISTDYLRWDERYCGLCHRRYDDEFKVCNRGESPCCLPCGHIAGHHCLRTHLSPYEARNTKCPFWGCDVDFPQMFMDAPEPSPIQPASTNVPWMISVDESEHADEEELSRQVSQLSNDSGVSSYAVKQFLSIEEVLARSGSESEGSSTGTEARDFFAAADARRSPEVGKEDFSMMNRGRGYSRTRAPRDVALISRNF